MEYFLKKEEKETHVSMSKTSDMMRIYTTESNVMRRLDRYVEESEDWNVVEVGRVKDKVISKTYEAPRSLLLLRKKKKVLSEEQKLAASGRLKTYWDNKRKMEDNDMCTLEDEDGENNNETNTGETNSSVKPAEESAFVPERSKPSYVKIKAVELVK